MNPWGEDVPKPKTASKDPLIETFEAIQLFERERKDSNIASYRRNDAYWIELKKLHVESLADLADFVEYLNHKKDSHRKQGIALSPTPSTRSSSKAKSSSTKDKDDSGGFNPGAGMQTRKALEEFDSSISAKYIEEADFIEKDLMKTFVSQAASIDSELKALWLRGDRLLFAVKLSDLRSKRNFDTFSHFVSVYSKRPIQNTQTVQKPDIAEVTRAEDIWLAEICYSVAAARSYEIKDECNKQLRFLFARAKDVEIRRRALIAKAGETLLARQLAVWRNFPTQSSMISERVIKIQTDPSDPLCNIGRTLANRVETSHDSVAMAMMNEQRDRERQTAQTGQVGAVGVMGYSIPIEMEGTTRLPFPLRSPSLTESAVFQRQDSTSIISTKWTPVLLCLSSAGFLHMFDIDPKGEQGTDSSAFSNIAGQTKKGVELEIFTIVADGAVVASAETSTAKIMQLDTQSLNNILVTENFMMPAVSLSVPRCTVQFTPTANDFVFEIIESTPNTGIESLFRSMTERRFTLRGSSQAQMIDWIVRIEASQKK